MRIRRSLTLASVATAALGLCCGLALLAAHAPGKPQPTAGAGAAASWRPRTQLHRFRKPWERGSLGLRETLKQLNTRASLLFIVAHPDDEDGGLLAWLTYGLGARVDLLTLNRGEGGQNLMSSDFWDRLGLVRTQELLAADRYYGVDRQYWTRAIDFGFSKTRRGSLRQWGRQRVLSDVVRVVRLTHPLVIASSFNGGPSDGHGQHQVSGEMAQLGYALAGNASQFPRQLQNGLTAWQPLKDYARRPFFRATRRGIYDYATGHTVPARLFNYITRKWMPLPLATNVQVPEGDYDPALGETYLQLARQGWSLQKTQNGGGGVPGPGGMDVGYHRDASRMSVPEHERNFFDGIDISLTGIADLAPAPARPALRQRLQAIQSAVDEARRAYELSRPWQSAPALARGLRLTEAMLKDLPAWAMPAAARADVGFELRVKARQFNRGLIQALGIYLGATTAAPHAARGPFARFMGPQAGIRLAIPGEHFGVAVRLSAEAPLALGRARIWLRATQPQGWELAPASHAAMLAPGRPASAFFGVTTPPHDNFTRPYFVRPGLRQSYYHLRDGRYRNLPFAPYPLIARAAVNYRGIAIEVAKVVESVRRVTGRGQVFTPLALAPALSLWIAPHAGIAPLNHRSFRVSVFLHSNAPQLEHGELRLRMPPSWHSVPAAAAFRLNEGGNALLSFQVFPRRLERRTYTLHALATAGGESYRQGYVTVGYPGLQPYYYYRNAEYRVTGVQARVAPGLRTGYISGTGDQVPQAIQQLGVPVAGISNAELAHGNLGQYSAIVLGIRAYAARPALAAYNDRLLDYVHRGGVLIVQYGTGEFNHNYGPYPYQLISSPPYTVVDETAPVRILMPQNPLLRWPNRITEADFAGWLEERGHDFLAHWDPRYQALLETHDPEQAPQRGGLLYARYGQGVYIYCAYALYRQLPEGVPGAYRLLANLISLARNPKRHAGRRAAP